MSAAGARINLNAAQRAAVEHLHGPLLVVAGAGTGKTRVITERILYLLQAIPEVHGDNILAITYTQKAAAEMAARLRRHGDKRAERVGVYTFHAFCYQILHRHQQALQILDNVHYWIFLRQRLHKLGLNIFKKLSEPGRFLNDFQEFFSRCQDELVSPEDYQRYVSDLAGAFEQQKELLGEEERQNRQEELARLQEIARVYSTAEGLLREAERTTFGGLLYQAVTLLRSNQSLRQHYQELFGYILIDEFQDANIAQIELLTLLAGQHRNVMAVGDDDQAIYRFRGASYASFRKFTDLFSDCRKISLTQNYRSSASILGVATTLIAQNGTARFDQKKRLLPQDIDGEKVHLAVLGDREAEAAYVRSEIERLRKQRGAYAHTAVLYRAHLHRRALVEELARAHIPFVIRGLSILANTLVRDLLAYLRVIDSAEDNVNLARLLAIPAWGLTPEMLLDLIHRARRDDHDHPSLAATIESLHPRVRDQQTRLGHWMRRLAELRARAAELPLTQLVDELLARLELRLLPADPNRPYLKTFIAFLRQWEEEKSQTKRLAEFIEYLNYFEEAGGVVALPEDTENRDAVHLMTAHSAKGLEFDSVFVLRLNSSDFPTPRRRPLFEFPQELMKEALPPGDFHIQEERRLCYVALTRARRQLGLTTLTGPRKKPSIFLEDILRDPQAARRVTQLTPTARPIHTADGSSARAPAQAGPQILFPAAPTAACYSRITNWATRPSGESSDGTLTLSHSGLETYSKCPLKYKFAHRWRLPGRATPAMIFGQVMHGSVTELFRTRQRQPHLPLTELKHIYEQQWRKTSWPARDSYQRQEYRASGWQQLQTFHEQINQTPVTVLELEKSFQWPWEDILLTGRIDQINRLRGPQVEIIEYKTGQPRPRKQVEKSLQLSLYALAVRHCLGYQPERLTLYNFTVNEAVSFPPDENSAHRTLEKVREIAARIRTGEFPARPGYHCRYCHYQSICPAFEQSYTLGGAATAGAMEADSAEGNSNAEN